MKRPTVSQQLALYRAYEELAAIAWGWEGKRIMLEDPKFWLACSKLGKQADLLLDEPPTPPLHSSFPDDRIDG